jgi:hypothetical protein
MVTGSDYPPTWVVLPGSLLTAELATRQWTKKPVIEIIGNRQGLVSLGNILLWKCFSQEESLSITALEFIKVKSTLSLTVVESMRGDDSSGRLIRVDKDQQFEWLIDDEHLEKQAVYVIDMGLSAWVYPRSDHFHGDVGPDSEYELFFARVEPE